MYREACSENTRQNKTDVKSVKVRLVNIDKDDCKPTPTCKMELEMDKGRVFLKEVLPDTGCSQTIISKSLAKTNEMFMDPKKTKQIWNASNELMLCKGTATFEVAFGGQNTEVMALMSPDLEDYVLLGRRALQRLKIILLNFPNVMKEEIVWSACVQNTPETDPKAEIEKTMAKFPTVLEEPSPDGRKLKPMKGGQMTIHMKKGEIKPTHIYTARICPYAFEEYAKDELDKSENMGIIQKVEGATQWCSSCSFVTKPGGGCRLVTDLKVIMTMSSGLHICFRRRRTSSHYQVAILPFSSICLRLANSWFV